MNINKIDLNGNITLTLEGRLDTTTSPKLQEVLIPFLEEAEEVTLDFTGLVYVSSAGLRVLLLGHKTAQGKNKSMRITGVSEEIMEVFDMTGFTDMLTIE